MKISLSLFAVSVLFGGSVLFATTPTEPALEVQFLDLSTTIIQQAGERNDTLQQLKKLFTSCANHHKNPSIQQACTNFLETSFPLLEHQRRSYRAEELQIPISGTVEVQELGYLSPEQVQKAVGIYQALSGQMQDLNYFGAMNEWRRGNHPYVPKEDIKYYLVSLPAEHFSFLLATETQTSDGAIQQIIAQLPTNWGFDKKSTDHLKTSPLQIQQTGGKISIESYRLAGADNISGGANLRFQNDIDFLITKYQLPAKATFEETVNKMKFSHTVNDYVGIREVLQYKQRTGELGSLTQYFTPEGTAIGNGSIDGMLNILNTRPLYTGDTTGWVSRVFPFGKNTNTLLQHGEIKILIGGVGGLGIELFVWNKKTPQVCYQISPTTFGFLTSAFLGSYAIEIDNENEPSSFIHNETS